MGGSSHIGGGSSRIGFKFNAVGGSGVTGLPAIQAKGESGKNAQTILDPAGNLDRIKEKIDKNSGINDLIAIQALFDLETQSLLAQRDSILNSINSADLEASRAVRTARINEARTYGRASTILSR